MATTVSLRKILDRKTWEMVTPFPLASSTASVLISSRAADGLILFMDSVTNCWLYSTLEDAWQQLASPAFTTWTQPAGTYHPNGPTGTASAGSATTLTTTTNLPGSMAGYSVRITAGTGAGQERVISANTYGANAVLTVPTWTVTPDNTSTYLLLTGRFWVANLSTTLMLKYYDVATNTWSGALSVAGLAAFTAGNGSALAATPGWGTTIAVGTATAGAASTLTNSGKSWTVNQWANAQVRITGGTGAGQVRTVASNTATVLTTSAAWTVNPDATSTYVLEGNDDFLYLAGNAAVTLYRYSISANTWSTLSPGVVRTTVASGGTCLKWVDTASDAAWATESAIRNGRYLYSFAGAGSANLAVYDLAANAWSNVQAGFLRSGGADFAPANTWYTVSDREFLYFARAQVAGGWALYRFNAVTQTLDPWSSYLLPQSTAVTSADRVSFGSYNDGGTTLRWVYYLATSTTVPTPFLRQLIF